jgi:uncharacterized protein (TIGR02996 family)
MTDGDALHAAILAAPDDDTPRLVYADWLDENGHPERAEFIRVQVALAHTPTLALRSRETTLLALHEAAWLAPFKAAGQPLFGAAHGQFRRGFVEIVWMTAKEFVLRGELLFSRIPMRELRVTRTTEGEFHELVTDCELVERLDGLDLSDRRLGDVAAMGVARGRHAGSLRMIRLRGCGITSLGAWYLASAPHPIDQAFRELDVSFNPIDADGLAALRKRYGEAVIAEGMMPPE